MFLVIMITNSGQLVGEVSSLAKMMDDGCQASLRWRSDISGRRSTSHFGPTAELVCVAVSELGVTLPCRTFSTEPRLESFHRFCGANRGVCYSLPVRDKALHELEVYGTMPTLGFQFLLTQHPFACAATHVLRRSLFRQTGHS